MNMKRTATLALVGVPAAAWLYAAATSGVVRREIAPAATRNTAIEARSAVLATEVARLHERLRPDATPRQPGRNLFAFTAARPAVVAAAARPALSEAAPMPLPPPPPPFKLIGIAENPGPEGPVRTAIISAPGQVFLVRPGDTIALRYRIVNVSADVVEMINVGDNSTLRLALR